MCVCARACAGYKYIETRYWNSELIVVYIKNALNLLFLMSEMYV